MDNTNGIVGLIAVIVIVAGGVMVLGNSDNGDMTALQAEIKALQTQLDNAEAADNAALIASLQAEIVALTEDVADLEAEDEEPQMHIVYIKTTEEFNQSFSAWGVCGRGEHHIKDRALERAEDFVDTLTIDNGEDVEITDITIKYAGREREWINNDTYCHITYRYDVDWVEVTLTEDYIFLTSLSS